MYIKELEKRANETQTKNKNENNKYQSRIIEPENKNNRENQ